MALWLRAPIETAKYSKEVPLGENSYRCGPVWSSPTTRKPTPYGRRPYSCVFTWASGFTRQGKEREREDEIGRTVCDGGHEAVYGDGPVEDHLGPHGLLAHKVAAHVHTQREREREGSCMHACPSVSPCWTHS